MISYGLEFNRLLKEKSKDLYQIDVSKEVLDLGFSHVLAIINTETLIRDVFGGWK